MPADTEREPRDDDYRAANIIRLILSKERP
jgi:hypothetical protein